MPLMLAQDQANHVATGQKKIPENFSNDPGSQIPQSNEFKSEKKEKSGGREECRNEKQQSSTVNPRVDSKIVLCPHLIHSPCLTNRVQHYPDILFNTTGVCILSHFGLL